MTPEQLGARLDADLAKFREFPPSGSMRHKEQRAAKAEEKAAAQAARREALLKADAARREWEAARAAKRKRNKV